MAEMIAGRGIQVTYAWTGPDSDLDSGTGPVDAGALPFDVLPLATALDLSDWLAVNRPEIVIIGYWELARWLPARKDSALVLDYVAPRLLERQFENRDRLVEEAAELIEVLARCDEVWVGNAAQRDVMLPLLLLAGHDCRFDSPVRVVPLCGRVDKRSSVRGEDDGERPLQLFHGGLDWPWRNSTSWLEALRREPGQWQLIDGSEGAGLAGHAEYLRRLRSVDIALELCDDNIERRYSQSFRMTDALCTGVPVICNDFLPLAELVERHQCGWVVERPEELPALLNSIAADRPGLARRADNALVLARARFDAARVYADLADGLARLAGRRSQFARQPLLAAGASESEVGADGPGMTAALRAYLAEWFHRRVRKPYQNLLSRAMADRPMPSADRACWVVLSRADVFPTDHGAAVKIERTAWGLSFHLEEVILLTDRRDGYWVYRRGAREFRRFPIWPRLAGWPRSVNMIRVMARGVPYSNAFLYLPWADRGMQYRLMWLMKRHRVETVQGEFPAYVRPAVWAARLFGSRCLMVEHNVEFQRIAEQVPDLGESARRRIKKFEIDLANACDRVVTVSNRDRRDLVSAGVREALVHTIPHGVDLERFANAEPIDLRARYNIPADHAVLVYHGIYSYPPNLEAVEELGHVLLPKLRALGRPATVVAIGPEPLAKALTGVVFTGAVDDLAEHLIGGDLAVIPLRHGGGTRMKILDDFAARVPVVTTAKGMEGIDVTHGRELLVIDDIDEMAEAVIDLLGDEQARRRLTDAAAQWVSRFDWREIARRYVELVRGAR
ncbi:MAG: glycosyltransferase [Wenzhouxiangellaceae bacterium]